MGEKNGLVLNTVKDTRILVVEDHSSVRTLLRVILEDEGYRVMEAEDGPAAVELAESAKPDLIILDLMMPALDGEHVIEELRERQATRHTPIIVVTAKEEAVERVGVAIGEENVLTKPFEEGQLLNRVGALVGAGKKPPPPTWKGEPRRS